MFIVICFATSIHHCYVPKAHLCFYWKGFHIYLLINKYFNHGQGKFLHADGPRQDCSLFAPSLFGNV